MLQLKESLLSAKLLCLVPAGGLGSRLWPLTEDRTKPAVAISFNDNGEITRMVDIPLKAIWQAGGSALVSTLYQPESLAFVNNYEYAQTLKESRPSSPSDTLLEHRAILEKSKASTVGIIPGDTWIDEATLGGMWAAMDMAKADAAMLSTCHLGIHNRHPIDSRGIITAKGKGKGMLADLGVHLFRKDWLLSRLAVCAEVGQQRLLNIFDDIYNINNPAGKVLMYVPPNDQGWVDMGTPAAFHNAIFLLNQRHADRNGNIVFPGASIKLTSTKTIALPNSKAGLPLNAAIVPEGRSVESSDRVLLLSST